MEEKKKPGGLVEDLLAHASEWWGREPGLRHARQSCSVLCLKLARVMAKVLPILQPVARFIIQLCGYLCYFLLRSIVRGTSSLLRLGSSSLFILFWCTIISLAALAGCNNFCIALGIAVLAAVFYGITFAVLMLGIFGMGILFVYGSPWPTLSVAIAGGILYYVDRCRTALLVTMVYSVYSVKGHGGWAAVSCCVGLAFLSSDVVVYMISLEDGEKEENKASPAYVAGMTGSFSASFRHTKAAMNGTQHQHANGKWRNGWGESVPNPIPSPAPVREETEVGSDTRSPSMGEGAAAEESAPRKGGGATSRGRGGGATRGNSHRAGTTFEGGGHDGGEGGGEGPGARDGECGDSRDRTESGCRGSEQPGVSNQNGGGPDLRKGRGGRGTTGESGDWYNERFQNAASYSPCSPLDETASVTSRGSGGTSTSGRSEVAEGLAEAEVLRVLGCRDHYTIFEQRKCSVADSSLLRQQYRKKAMLLHPDKNGGCENAAEAFKRLQNAYEVLLDPGKKKEYDAQLIEQEIKERMYRQRSRQGFDSCGCGRMCDWFGGWSVYRRARDLGQSLASIRRLTKLMGMARRKVRKTSRV